MTNLRLSWVLAALLASCSSSGFETAAPAHETAAALDVLDPAYRAPLEALAARVEEERQNLHLPGVALAIVKDDRVIFARGFGLADVEHARPVTPETLFAIGSTTKAFTATLVGMLSDEKKLALDDPITKTLPWFTLPIQAKEGEQVTLRDLMSHRTGFARMDVLWAGGKASADEVLRTATHAEPMAPFRTKFLYNNIMFLAAGEACATVTGKPWAELVRERVFEPLGMRSTDTSVAVAQQDPRLALGYRWDDDAHAFVHLPMRSLGSIAPAGAINSNVLDMARWVRFQLGHGAFEQQRLISAAAFDELWKPNNTMGPDAQYGLGWMLHHWQEKPYVEHGGNIDGFAAEVALLPEQQLGLVMLTNVSATALQSKIGPLAFEALLGASTPAESAPAASEDFSRYTGTYIANYFQFHDARFEVKVQHGRLAIDVPGQMLFELLAPDANGKRSFAMVPEQIQASFVEEGGRIVALLLYQGGLTVELPRPDWQPAPEISLDEARPYLGTYLDPATKKNFAVVLQRGRLAVDYPAQMVYELFAPKEDGHWVFRASAQMALEFQLDGDGVADSVTFHDHGTQRNCERVGDGALVPPSVAELLALRRASAFEARLAALGICRLAGTLRFVHCGIQGTTSMLCDARGRIRDTTDLQPFVWTQTAFDGEHAWHQSSLEPRKELSGASLDEVHIGSLAVFGDWNRHFDSAVVERVDEENGRRSARVRLVKGKAPPVVLKVDLANGDILGAEEAELVDGGQTFPKTLTFEDWRDIEGLRLPMRIVSEDDVTGKVVIQYQTLETGLTPAGEPFALEQTTLAQ